MASLATEHSAEGLPKAAPPAIANPFGRVLSLFHWNPFHEMEPVSVLMKPGLLGAEASLDGELDSIGAGVLTIYVPKKLKTRKGPGAASSRRA